MNQELKFGAVAVIHPDCADHEKVRTYVGPLGTSVMIWGGDKDVNEPYNCHLLWPDGKRNAKFGSKIFPDTHHGFGFPGVKRQTVFGGARTLTSAPKPAGI